MKRLYTIIICLTFLGDIYSQIYPTMTIWTSTNSPQNVQDIDSVNFDLNGAHQMLHTGSNVSSMQVSDIDSITFELEVNVQTLGVHSVSATTAAFIGGASSYSNITDRGICWWTSTLPTLSGSNSYSAGSGSGTINANMFGLLPSTTYYVRAYATTAIGTYYGYEVTFTTSAPIGLPTVTTSAVNSVSTTYATFDGVVTSQGGTPVTARGFCYGTSPSPTISNNTIGGGSGTGSFTANVTGLSSGATYYVKAYAINSGGISYGNELTFTTLAPGSGRVYFYTHVIPFGYAGIHIYDTPNHSHEVGTACVHGSWQPGQSPPCSTTFGDFVVTLPAGIYYYTVLEPVYPGNIVDTGSFTMVAGGCVHQSQWSGGSQPGNLTCY